ncbi:DUF3124 domain-containing protein [Thiovibrio sp. JS02]
MKKTGRLFLLLSLLLTAPALSGPARAGECPPLSDGQSVYVPAYSHIYYGNRERPFLLTVTLSIRNIDPKHPVTLSKVAYYETRGKLIRTYLEKPLTLGPLESIRYVVPQRDETGGSGANFIVNWNSDSAVNPPLIESIMIGAESQQGISFTSRGQAIVTDN